MIKSKTDLTDSRGDNFINKLIDIMIDLSFRKYQKVVIIESGYNLFADDFIETTIFKGTPADAYDVPAIKRRLHNNVYKTFVTEQQLTIVIFA